MFETVHLAAFIKSEMHQSCSKDESSSCPQLGPQDIPSLAESDIDSLVTMSSTSAMSDTFDSTLPDQFVDEIPPLHIEHNVLPAAEVVQPSRSLSLQRVLNIHANTFHHENNGRPLVVGHRGAPYKYLENTRHSFLAAVAIGCKEVELDVFVLKCGTLVVFHGSGDPGWTKEYFGKEGTINDYTYEEARNFKFNPHYADFGCGSDRIIALEDECYIPTLEEVLLDLKLSGVIVKIELKGPGTSEPTLELVEKLGLVDQCHFSSFELRRIKRIRELRPERGEDGTYRYKTGALFNDIPDDFVNICKDLGATEIHLRYNTCSSEKVAAIHAAGMDSLAWLCGPITMRRHATEVYYDLEEENRALYQMLIDTGVRKICANKPDLLLLMTKE